VETRVVGKKHSPLVYLSTARTVQKHAVQNLNDAVAVGHSLQSISRHGFDNSIDGSNEHLDGEQTDRRDRYALTDTAVEVANIDSFSKYERIDTLARLVSLSEIAGKTGR